MVFESKMAQELPDNLRGDQWSFVQFPLAAVEEEALAQVDEGFGQYMPSKVLNLSLPPDALIPGSYLVLCDLVPAPM